MAAEATGPGSLHKLARSMGISEEARLAALDCDSPKKAMRIIPYTQPLLIPVRGPLKEK